MASTDSLRQQPYVEGRLRIAGTVNDSIVDGEGYRFTIFTQGCPHGCPGCHNPQTHDFAGGKEVDTAELLQRIGANPLLEGVTFSGGEPFCQAEPLAAMAEELHAKGLTVWCYTGFVYEQLVSSQESAVQRLLQQVDVLVDGPYVEAQRDLLLTFRGSRNQRIIDVPQSLAQGQVVLYQLEEY